MTPPAAGFCPAAALFKALGAKPGGVLAMVVRQGLSLTAVGLAIGLALALAVGRLAASLLRAGYPEKAQAAIGRCLALNPNEPLYLMDLGEILIRRGKPDAAADAYARAASLNPVVAGGAWYRLGTLLAKEGFHPPATEAFAKAVAAEPENTRYLLGLAASYATRGLTDLAGTALHRMEKLSGQVNR